MGKKKSKSSGGGRGTTPLTIGSLIDFTQIASNNSNGNGPGNGNGNSPTKTNANRGTNNNNNNNSNRKKDKRPRNPQQPKGSGESRTPASAASKNHNSAGPKSNSHMHRNNNANNHKTAATKNAGNIHNPTLISTGQPSSQINDDFPALNQPLSQPVPSFPAATTTIATNTPHFQHQAVAAIAKPPDPLLSSLPRTVTWATSKPNGKGKGLSSSSRHNNNSSTQNNTPSRILSRPKSDIISTPKPTAIANKTKSNKVASSSTTASSEKKRNAASLITTNIANKKEDKHDKNKNNKKQQLSNHNDNHIKHNNNTTVSSKSSKKKAKKNNTGQKQQQQRTQQSNSEKLLSKDLISLFRKPSSINNNKSTSTISNAANSNLMQHENMLPLGLTVRKGRQKMRTRKKKLTSLKKQVLMERLEQWQSLQKTREEKEEKENSTANDKEQSTSKETTTTTVQRANGGIQHENIGEANDDDFVVCLQGYVDPDEMQFQKDDEDEDEEDEFNEIVYDLTNLAEKITLDNGSSGTIQVYIPRNEEKHVGWAFVFFCGNTPTNTNKSNRNSDFARAAKECWHDLVIGGNCLKAGLVKLKEKNNGISDFDDNPEKAIRWKEEINSMSESDLVVDIDRNDNNDDGEKRSNIASGDNGKNITWTVRLDNILTEDDFEDAECLEETKDDVKMLGMKYGTVLDLSVETGQSKSSILLSYEDQNTAMQAVDGFNNMNIGGISVTAGIVHHSKEEGGSDDHYEGSILILENVLTEDDYDDEECREETMADVMNLVSEFGSVASIKLDLEKEDDQKGQICIQYDDKSKKSYTIAAQALNEKLIGGQKIIARHISNNRISPTSAENTITTLVLENILTEDDFDDEDCLDETRSDVLDMVQKFGEIENINIELDGVNKGQIIICFKSDDDEGTIASKAANALNESTMGGQIITAQCIKPMVPNKGQGEACLSTTENPLTHSTKPNDQDKKDQSKETEPKPLYSGDKIIPEQYAKCKRVPKVPTPAEPREYASKYGEEAVSLLIEMLGELMRLQQRSKDDKNARARRRLVMGLREVARGIRAHKVKMVVMANNLDQYGVIDSRLQEILNLAREEDVPVFFDLNKRKLGKALGKSIKVSVVGIQNADGAYEPFKKLKKIAM